MGTNFYWKKEERPPCECCERPYVEEEIHIGKSSAGWTFALYTNHEIQSLDDWKNVWETQEGFIEDEYGTRITTEEMIDRITNRSREEPLDDMTEEDLKLHGSSSVDVFLDRNYAIRGPNNLIRRKISDHCIGHGEGTWDYVKGEFC